MGDGFGSPVLGGASKIIRKSLEFVDVNGNTLFSMDSTGNLTGQTLSGNNDIILDGNSLKAVLSNAFVPDQWHTFTLLNGWLPGSVPGNGYPSYKKLVWDNLVYVSGILQAPATITSIIFGNLPSGYYNKNTQVEFPVVDLDGTSATPYVELNPDGTIEIDNAIGGHQYVINGIVSTDIPNYSGTGSNQQTYTKTYNCLSTASYWNFSPNLRSTSTCFQGTEGSTSSQVSYIQWPASTIVADITGATINWVTVTATNQHTWYNSGGILDLGWASSNDYSNGLHGADHPTLVNQHFNEGQKLTFNVFTGYVNNFLTGGMNYSIIGDGSTTDLNFYGYWAGGANSWQMTINYTK